MARHGPNSHNEINMEVDVGLLRKAHAKHTVSRPHHKTLRGAASRSRHCRFEQLEPRQFLSATVPALNVGATYYQPYDGNDSVGSLLYISWNGGAPSTQLTDLYIDTHKVAGNEPQFSVTNPVDGDVFFHIAPSNIGGTMAGVPPQVVEWSGTVQPVVTVSNDSTLIHIQFVGQDFQASGRLVLKVNVDILQSWSGGDATRVVEGADFDGTSFEAVFAAPHYQTTTVAGFFRNVYRRSGHHLRTESAGRQLRQFVGNFHHKHAARRAARAGVHRRHSGVDPANAAADHSFRYRVRRPRREQPAGGRRTGHRGRHPDALRTGRRRQLRCHGTDRHHRRQRLL